MVFVGIPTCTGILFINYQTAIVAAVRNPSSIQWLGSALIPTTAAPNFAIVASVPMIPNPPIVRGIIRATMAVAVCVIPGVLETGLAVALAEIHISHQVEARPRLVLEDAAVPAVVAARDRTFQVGSLVIFSDGARLLQ